VETDFKQQKYQSAVYTATVRVLSLVWQELEYQMYVRKATNRAAEYVASHKDTKLRFLFHFKNMKNPPPPKKK